MEQCETFTSFERRELTTTPLETFVAKLTPEGARGGLAAARRLVEEDPCVALYRIGVEPYLTSSSGGGSAFLSPYGLTLDACQFNNGTMSTLEKAGQQVLAADGPVGMTAGDKTTTTTAAAPVVPTSIPIQQQEDPRVAGTATTTVVVEDEDRADDLDSDGSGAVEAQLASSLAAAAVLLTTALVAL